MLGTQTEVTGTRSRAGLEDVDVIIMDLDGVVTDTARVHAAAWKEMFDAYLRQREERFGERFVPFEVSDYLRYVDGKPRCDGVRDFLASRRITLPEGEGDDPPERETVCGLGNRKNRQFIQCLEVRRAEPYPGTVSFVRAWAARGRRLALVSASRNARKVLQMSGLADAFDLVVDGNDLADRGLKGKPAPDLFLEAARQLNVAPERAAVVEDAIAGVEAARAGGFALVIGVDRAGQAAALEEHGADIVVRDLSELGAEVREERRSALDHSESIFRRLVGGIPIVFLDYDGTMTPIVARPDLATLSDDMRTTLRQLARECQVVVVSGRDLNNVMRLVGLDDLGYAGSHGFEMVGPLGSFSESERGLPFLKALDAAEEQLRAGAAGIEGALVDRKRFALALHYRMVGKEEVPKLEALFDEVAGQHPDLRPSGGKMVFELRPNADWDKGKAVLAMIERLHLDPTQVVPLYIGDDLTDEDAFRAINDRGITIMVSDRPRETAARYFLTDVPEVQVFLDRMVEGFESEVSSGIWSLTYSSFEPAKEQLREALCTLGNGYMATRGSAPEATAGEVHYPGTYLAGTYDRLESDIDGHTLVNESIVNIPDWSSLSFRIEDGEWFDVSSVIVEKYHQELDMRNGVLERTIRFSDGGGRRTMLRQRRFVSMDEPNLACLEVTIVPENWSGMVSVRSALDGRVGNTLVARYRQLNNRHLVQLGSGTADDDTIWLQAETVQSHVRIAVVARTDVFLNGRVLSVDRDTVNEHGHVSQSFAVRAIENRPLRIEKIAAVHSSRDRAISESLVESIDLVAHSGDFLRLLGAHARRWELLWDRYRIEVDPGHIWISQILNLHVFHLLENVSMHSVDLDVGIAPRGIAGEAYRGLIMWDEVFIFPFLNLHDPDLTRSLLLYRYRRLPRARWAARKEGYQGAMFPWQSGSDGREEAQTMHLNPLSGRWIPDNSHLEQHIGLAIAYNVWQYYQVTHDLTFMSMYGAELLCEIARFWVSRCSYSRVRERYEILKIMGPDEFHEGYPDRAEAGVDNNAYTNVMVAWTLQRALEALKEMPLHHCREVRARLSIDDEELERWDEIAKNMHVPFHGEGIISQFDGYDDLLELDLGKFMGRYCSIHRMDRILEADGDSVQRYKISKQADVLMLLYLFSEDEIREVLGRMGYSMTPDAVRRTIEYYSKRTPHGSTLSRVVHAWVLSRYNREGSWSLFLDALKSDVSDIQCGTTHEGIHLGAMASTVDIVQRCYTGLETRGGALLFDPRLPNELKRLKFELEYRGHLLEVDIDRERLRLVSRPGEAGPISIGHRGDMHQLEPGGTLEVLLDEE
ncbi:MAG: trehalose-phosphatase [Methanomassiliicoccus sp.]|nr:trehalose-phosphatase [Methanomassiliicoccus sp.]